MNWGNVQLKPYNDTKFGYEILYFQISLQSPNKSPNIFTLHQINHQNNIQNHHITFIHQHNRPNNFHTPRCAIRCAPNLMLNIRQIRLYTYYPSSRKLSCQGFYQGVSAHCSLITRMHIKTPFVSNY